MTPFLWPAALLLLLPRQWQSAVATARVLYNPEEGLIIHTAAPICTASDARVGKLAMMKL